MFFVQAMEQFRRWRRGRPVSHHPPLPIHDTGAPHADRRELRKRDWVLFFGISQFPRRSAKGGSEPYRKESPIESCRSDSAERRCQSNRRQCAVAVARARRRWCRFDAQRQKRRFFWRSRRPIRSRKSSSRRRSFLSAAFCKLMPRVEAPRRSSDDWNRETVSR